MACVLDHDPSAPAHFLSFTILAVQGLAANLLPRQFFLRLSACFAGRRHVPFGERILSRAIARITRGAHFATKSAAAGVVFPPTGSWPSLTNSMDRCIPRSYLWQNEAGSASLWLHSEPARHCCCPTSASCEGWSSNPTSFPARARSHGRHNGETHSRTPLPSSAFEPCCEAASTA